MKKKTTLAILACISLLICPHDLKAQKKLEWDIVARNDTYMYAYNPKRVTRTSDGTLKVWIKQLPTLEAFANGKAKEAQIEIRKKTGKPTAGYNEWSYNLILFEYSCSERRSRILSVIDYGKNGAMLDSEKPVMEWEDIIPDSVDEKIMEHVCKPLRR